MPWLRLSTVVRSTFALFQTLRDVWNEGDDGIELRKLFNVLDVAV
jgi:hypothetical protein